MPGREARCYSVGNRGKGVGMMHGQKAGERARLDVRRRMLTSWLGNLVLEEANMRRSILAIAGFGALIAAAPTVASAQSYWDLEHARANARAGGPISEQDAELLERYGCLSGTNSAFCKKLSSENRYVNKKARQRAERRVRRND